jgi:hypothetical protein
MTGVGDLHSLLTELYEAESDLAAEFREVARRTGGEPDVHHMCGTLAGQCDAHAEALRAVAAGYDLTLNGDGDPAPRAAARVCRVAVETAGNGNGGEPSPSTGPLLLGYLRELYLAVERVDLDWLVAGQVAQALRDRGFLEQVTALHSQTRTQAAWLKTKIRESAPQIILTP